MLTAVSWHISANNQNDGWDVKISTDRLLAGKLYEKVKTFKLIFGRNPFYGFLLFYANKLRTNFASRRTTYAFG